LFFVGIYRFDKAVGVKDQTVPWIKAKGVLWFVGKTLFLNANDEVLARQQLYGRTLAAEAADFEPVPAGKPPTPAPEVAEERDTDGRKVLQFPKAFDED